MARQTKKTFGTTKDWLAKAHVLTEALPFMQRYDRKIVVIKFGGHAMGDANLSASFANDIVLLKQSGIHPIIVHGGGPQIGERCRLQLFGGHESQGRQLDRG